MKSISYQCDKCKTPGISGKPALELTAYVDTDPISTRNFDLCAPCLGDLIAWITRDGA